MNQKILYIDMDNVIVNFQSGIDLLSEQDKIAYQGRYDEVPNIFSLMTPIGGALEAIEKLYAKYEI